MHCVSTITVADNWVNHSSCKNKFGPQSKNLAAIIHRFKAAITKQAHEIHADFACQSRVQTPHIKTLKQNTDYQ
jgi:hypothetical protein